MPFEMAAGPWIETVHQQADHSGPGIRGGPRSRRVEAVPLEIGFRDQVIFYFHATQLRRKGKVLAHAFRDDSFRDLPVFGSRVGDVEPGFGPASVVEVSGNEQTARIASESCNPIFAAESFQIQGVVVYGEDLVFIVVFVKKPDSLFKRMYWLINIKILISKNFYIPIKHSVKCVYNNISEQLQCHLLET